MFTPEFRNRLDGWIAFEPLSFEVSLRIVDKFIKEVQEMLVEKQVTLELADEAREWLAKKGYDKLFGARPMARLVQSKIKEPLADEILFGKLQHGGNVVVTVNEDDIKLNCG